MFKKIIIWGIVVIALLALGYLLFMGGNDEDNSLGDEDPLLDYEASEGPDSDANQLIDESLVVEEDSVDLGEVI